MMESKYNDSGNENGYWFVAREIYWELELKLKSSFES